MRDWLTRTLFPDGTEPDARFTLANERTFLAWTRTALAFLAGGIALNAVEILPARWNTAASVVLVTVSLVISLTAAARWVRVERAMRHGKPLPAPVIIPLLMVACIIAAVVVLVGVL